MPALKTARFAIFSLLSVVAFSIAGCGSTSVDTTVALSDQPHVIHVADRIESYLDGERRHSIAEESRTILPTYGFVKTVKVDGAASWEGGTLPLSEILALAEAPDDVMRVSLRSVTAYGIVDQVLALPPEPDRNASLNQRIRLIPEDMEVDAEALATKNLLVNAGFEDFAFSITPTGWDFDMPPDDGPRIGGRLDNSREGRFHIELLPRTDGEPTRLVQRVPTEFTTNDPVEVEFSAWLRASAPNAFFAEVLVEREDGTESVARTAHPGDGAWHEVRVTATIDQPDNVHTLHAVLRREQVQGVGETLIDETTLLVPNVMVLAAELKIVTQSVGEVVSEELTIPAGGRLETALAAFRPFSAAPQAQSVSLRISVDDGSRIDEVATESIAIGQGQSESAEWHEVEYDLSRWAGKSVRLRFDSDVDDTATVVPLWGSVVLTGAAPEQAAAPPNVILISLDTLRADRIGAYGYGKGTTPHLDAFAESAHLFERCMAVSSWTTPSHATVFSGEMPSVHGAGIVRRGTGKRSQLPKSFTTLAETARAGEYRTAAFTEGFFVASRWGLAQGFERYFDGSIDLPNEKVVDDTFDRARTWLDRHGESPFFLFVHTYGVHWPYTPPAEYLERYVGTATPVFPPGDRLLSGDLSDAEFELLSAAYDAGIAYVDDIVGEFFAYLDSAGLLENTYVIIFSDHGEELGEHGGAMHGLTLYNEVLHVPLIIRTPGQETAARYPELVGIGDIYGTVLDILGRPDAAKPSILDAAAREQIGASVQLAELIHHRSESMHFTAQTRDEKIYLATPYGQEGTVFPDSVSEFEVDFDIATLLRLIDTAGGDTELTENVQHLRREFYRLIEDPDEQRNVFDSHLDEARTLMNRAREALEGAQARMGGATSVDLADPLTPEEREQFEALGYVQD